MNNVIASVIRLKNSEFKCNITNLYDVAKPVPVCIGTEFRIDPFLSHCLDILQVRKHKIVNAYFYLLCEGNIRFCYSLGPNSPLIYDGAKVTRDIQMTDIRFDKATGALGPDATADQKMSAQELLLKCYSDRPSVVESAGSPTVYYTGNGYGLERDSLVRTYTQRIPDTEFDKSAFRSAFGFYTSYYTQYYEIHSRLAPDIGILTNRNYRATIPSLNDPLHVDYHYIRQRSPANRNIVISDMFRSVLTKIFKCCTILRATSMEIGLLFTKTDLVENIEKLWMHEFCVLFCAHQIRVYLSDECSIDLLTRIRKYCPSMSNIIHRPHGTCCDLFVHGTDAQVIDRRMYSNGLIVPAAEYLPI